MAIVFWLSMMVTETGPSKFKAGTDASNASADRENNAEEDYSNYNTCNNAGGEFKADRWLITCSEGGEGRRSVEDGRYTTTVALCAS